MNSKIELEGGENIYKESDSSKEMKKRWKGKKSNSKRNGIALVWGIVIAVFGILGFGVAIQESMKTFTIISVSLAVIGLFISIMAGLHKW